MQLEPLNVYSFGLEDSQVKKMFEWIRTLPDAEQGAIGGRFTYCFTLTSLGVVSVVKDGITGQEIDLTDYDAW